MRLPIVLLLAALAPVAWGQENRPAKGKAATPPEAKQKQREMKPQAKPKPAAKEKNARQRVILGTPRKADRK
jgi:hypothetical protein